jgi:hypothetical protein
MRAYGIRTIDEKAIGELYGQFLVGYWPQERFLTEQAYKRIAFPSENPLPRFHDVLNLAPESGRSISSQLVCRA